MANSQWAIGVGMVIGRWRLAIDYFRQWAIGADGKKAMANRQWAIGMGMRESSIGNGHWLLATSIGHWPFPATAQRPIEDRRDDWSSIVN